MKSRLEGLMEAEAELERKFARKCARECARVWGEDRAKVEAQRIMGRWEDRMRREGEVLVAMLPEIRRVEELSR
jgi:hypothetical protein